MGHVTAGRRDPGSLVILSRQAYHVSKPAFTQIDDAMLHTLGEKVWATCGGYGGR